MGRRRKIDNVTPIHHHHETDEEIAIRIEERFLILKLMTDSCINGYARSLIVSGPPGLGKTYTIEKALTDYDASKATWTMASGYSRATGLYKLLYRHRFPGNVLVLDDIDVIFTDEVSLSLLKKVCDTTEERNVSWLSEGDMVDDDGNTIPKTFSFEGSVIFITNLDFDKLIDSGDKRSPHLQALVSRSHYLDLTLKSRKEFMIRVNQVIAEGMLDEYGENIKNKTVDYMEENINRLREISLRMAIKISQNFKSYGEDLLGVAMCNATVLKQR